MNRAERIEQMEYDIEELQHLLDAVISRLNVLEMGDAMSLPPATLDDEWPEDIVEVEGPEIVGVLHAISGINARIDWRAEAEADWEDGMDFPPYPGDPLAGADDTPFDPMTFVSCEYEDIDIARY